MMTQTSSSVLALDVGDRRVGVAVASRIARLPRPLTTVQNDDSIWETIRNLLISEDADVIVVGLPRGLNGNDTEQTATTRLFVENLAMEVEARIVLQDEAMTSRQAEAELAARGSKPGPGDIDSLAATYILEDYLRENGDKA